MGMTFEFPFRRTKSEIEQWKTHRVGIPDSRYEMIKTLLDDSRGYGLQELSNPDYLTISLKPFEFGKY